MSAGRVLLGLGALLLLATAVIHAMGQAMMDSWIQGLSERQKAGLCLMWIAASISWAVVALIWGVAAWRQERGWLGASAVAALIPLSVAVGIMRIDSTFFGGWMLFGSIALAAAGVMLTRRSAAAP
jgi:hypothetical protein